MPTAVVVRGPAGELASYRRSGGGRGPRWTCGYYAFENASPSSPNIAVDYRGGPVSPEPGSTYVLACRDETDNIVQTRFVTYDPADPLAGLFAAERAAEQALEQLPIADPEVMLSPPGRQIVGIPTWLWVAGVWAPTEASASIGAVTSTVVATPIQVAWDLGDGTTKACAGPGTPFDADRPASEQASDCAHTFIWPSSLQPFGVFPVSATITYDARWTATTGAGGQLGVLTRTTTIPVNVVEVQAVIG
jgi:hypothetical protein